MSMEPATGIGDYDPQNWELRTFFDYRQKFLDGEDSPRDYLERCLEVIDRLEPQVKAWAYLNTEPARRSADEASERYKHGRPLSLVDGMPIGIKDLIETADMPTEYNSDLFRGNQPIRDAASVYFLRKGGAVILGKTVTITFGGGDPAETRNPFDLRRTPGGSSSGTCAGVGSTMIPCGLGTHGRGSTIRPSSFCGVYGLKGTFGALNRQGSYSAAETMDHLGVIAGSLQDMWIVARYISEHAGGDPGHPGLYGGRLPPAARKPERLIVLETAGWSETDDETKEKFNLLLQKLQSSGIELYRRNDDPAIESYERETSNSPEMWRQLYRFEMRFPMYQYLDYDSDRIPPRLKMGVEEGRGLTQAEYRQALVRREYWRTMHDELANRCDGMITLSSPGPGPIGMDQGSAIYNEASSIIGMPAVSLPLLHVENMPTGVQLQGMRHRDEALVAAASWIVPHILGKE
jgi:Asp-tRNA(Asn)/Glu-tRNA(Gln) amidotransferase A subunit family amidase